jgi:GxxExxY protein
MIEQAAETDAKEGESKRSSRRLTQMSADFSETDTKGDPETYAVIGAAMEVHRELRQGLLEAVYQDALEVEFGLRNIPCEREKHLEVHYKGNLLPSFYKADFVCFESVIVECKSQSSIGPADDAQVINYLALTGLQRAILLNFGAPSLQYKRLIFSKNNLRKSA